MNRREFITTVAAVATSAQSMCLDSQKPVTKVTAVDTHAHVFHRGLKFIPQRRYTPDYDALPKQYLDTLDTNNISHGVIIPISILGTDNSYTLKVLRMSQGRLRGLAVVDPKEDLDKLDMLEANGIVGIRFNLIRRPVPDIKSSPWKELIAECVKRDWQVEVYDNAKRLPKLLASLVDAGAKVVVDHFGKPNPQQGVSDRGFQYLLGLASSNRVWVKLSAPYRSSVEIAAIASPLLRKAFGPEKLLWGSDWPFTGFKDKIQYTSMRSLLNLWIPDPTERNIVLAETPAKLFKF